MNSWKYSEKFCNKYGADYRGKINWTKSGGICQNWGSQTPVTHTFGTSSNYPATYEYRTSYADKTSTGDMGTGTIKSGEYHNYCRTMNVKDGKPTEDGQPAKTGTTYGNNYGSGANANKNDDGLMGNTNKNEKDLNGDTSESKRPTPWCFFKADRYGVNIPTHTDDAVWGTDSGEFLSMADWNKGDKRSYNLFDKIGKASTGGMHMTHANTAAQRCWVANPEYTRWDCHDAEDNTDQDEIHGNFFNNLIIGDGSYESVIEVRASGNHKHPEHLFKRMVISKDQNNITTNIEKNQGWTALANQITPNSAESLNTQEHWIRIKLASLIDIHKIYIQDGGKNISSLPILVSTYEHHPESEPVGNTTMRKNNGFVKLLYRGQNYVKHITQFNNSGSAELTVDKPAKTVLIRFIKPVFVNNFSISQIIITRIYHNYEMNYNKNKNEFELFDYSGHKKKLIKHGEPSIMNFSSGYGVNFTKNSHYKLGNKIPIRDNQQIQSNSTNPETIKPIVMIGCWFKKPFVDTNDYHVLVSNDIGTFMPCVIDKDQNKLGCLLGNREFRDSGIRIGELKNGWHYLMIFATSSNIRYYINGIFDNSTNGDGSSGICINLPTFYMDNISIIGNSNTASNPWGMLSNLNIYCNWGKRYNDENSKKIQIDPSTNYDVQRQQYVRKQWARISANTDWKKQTCPNHSTLIKKAINTAKSTATSANNHKLKRVQKEFEKEIKEAVQRAENFAYKKILTFVSNSKNVVIWPNIHIKGKKIKLVAGDLNAANNQLAGATSIGIKNIQVYGNVNKKKKDWITDPNTKVELSSQPNVTNIIDYVSSRSYRSDKSGDEDDSIASVSCPNNEYLTSCKCYSPTGSCEGANMMIDNEQYQKSGGQRLNAMKKYKCVAHNKKFGSGVYAQAVCSKFTGIKNDTFSLENGPKSGVNTEQVGGTHMVSGVTNIGFSEVSCNNNANNDGVPRYMVGCTCVSNNNGCDGSQMIQETNQDEKVTKCKVFARPNGDVQAQALCMKIEGDKKMPNVSQKTLISKNKSGTKDDDPISLKCEDGYSLIDGDCKSETGSCDGARLYPEKNEVVAHNKEYGTGVHATANCMKFNIIDDNCIDGSLNTECITGSDKRFPSITFTFDKMIDIEKIVIYNRGDNKHDNNLPLNIHIYDDHDHIIMTGIKRNYHTPIEITNIPPKPPAGCKGFDDLNITDKGYALTPDGKQEFRQWADIRGIGKKCDYCRVVGKDKRMISCALGNNSYNQYAYNSIAGVDMGLRNPAPTQFFSPECNKDKDNFCYLKLLDDGKKTRIECLENTPSGFGEICVPPDQDSNYFGLSGKQILKQRNPFDTSKCVLNTYENNYNTYKVDAGFYWPRIGRYFLFKNSILDSTNVVIFNELDSYDDNEIHDTPLIMNDFNWEGVHFDSIDATLFTDIDPVSPNMTGLEIVYFFLNDQCIKYNLKSDSIINSGVKGSVNIKTEFEDLPFESIDSACYLGDGNCIFFKENQFVTYNMKAKLEGRKCCGTPSYMSQTPMFSQIPFTASIDSAICFYDTPEKYILFFKNDQVIEFNKYENKVKCSTNSKTIAPGTSITDFYTNATNNKSIWDIQIDTAFNTIRTKSSDKKIIKDLENETKKRDPKRMDCGPKKQKSSGNTCKDNKELVQQLKTDKKLLQTRLNLAKQNNNTAVTASNAIDDFTDFF